MSNITYRLSATPTLPGSSAVKGSPLTNTDVDANFKAIDNDILLRATLVSPTLTGTPTAPTAAAATNTIQLATTAHVFAERTNAATLTNKTLIGPTITNPENTEVTLVDGATVAWDTDTGHVAKWIVQTSTARVFNRPTNARIGGEYVLFIGNGTPGAVSLSVTWTADILWPNGTPPDLTVAAGYWTIIRFYNSSAHSKLLGSYTQGYPIP